MDIARVISVGIDFGYVVAIISVLAATAIPKLNSLLYYGKTLGKQRAPIDIYVPKRWFTHFYLIDLILSLLSFMPLSLHGSSIHPISQIQFRAVRSMMIVQSSRRLIECLWISKWSNSAQIHLTHYLVGIFFYVTVNLQPLIGHLTGQSDIGVPGLSIIRLIFGLASLDQLLNHRHLSQLVKYNRPTKGLFKWVACAHYFDEIVIYICYAMILRNVSSFLVALWVLINLSASANQSFRFYKAIGTLPQHYWRVIPGIY